MAGDPRRAGEVGWGPGSLGWSRAGEASWGGMQPCWPARPRVRTRTLRRLIGSPVVVRPARMSRRHERPSWMVVSRRSGKRPPRWAARLQAKVGSGSASPPLGRADEPGPAHGLLCQFGLAGLVSAGRRADAARLGGLREGPLGLTSAGPSAAAAQRWGARPQAKVRYVPAARAGGSAWPPTGCAAPALPCQVADSRTQDCEAAHHVSWRRAA